MSNPAPTLNQIDAFNATQGTTIDFNIIGGTEVIRSNKIYIYDLSDNSLICTHLYVSTESIHELPPNTSSSIVYASGKSSADFTNNTQYYAQIQTFTDTAGTQGGSGLSVAKMFWCLVDPTLTITAIPSTISTTSYNVSATYTDTSASVVSNIIQQYQFNLYSAVGSLLQSSGVVVGSGEQQGTSTAYDISYNFSGLSVGSSYYVAVDVTTTQGMNVTTQSNTFTVSIDTPTLGEATVVNNACDGYISVTSNLSSEYEHEESAEAGEIMSFTTDSVNDITELSVDFEPVQDGTPWMSAQDTEPYMFRAVPTQTEDFGYESDTIVGGTVGWNQLVQNGNFVDTSNWSASGYGTMVVSDNVLTYTVTDNGGACRIQQNNVDVKTGHKYIISGDFKYSDNRGGISFRSNNNGWVANKKIDGIANTWIRYDAISNATADGNILYIYLNYYNTTGSSLNIGDTIQIKNIHIHDLTAMFGTTIADYIYSLEQANAGAGVAWFRKLFPKPYYEYNAGELISVEGLESHDMVGFNQWDEEWEVGVYSSANGTKSNATNRIRCKNLIPVIPDTVYYFKSSSATSVYGYDINGEFVRQLTTVMNQTQKIPNDVYNITFNTAPNSGDTYNNDICINLSDASLNGTYKPYTKHSYPLDSTLTLRGIAKLDASNNLYYDGDIYASDGAVTRKYGVVDLGTLTWSYDSTNAFFYTSGISSLVKRPTSTTSREHNLVAEGYTIALNSSGDPLRYGDGDALWQNVASKSIAFHMSSTLPTINLYVYIKDSDYTDAASFKTAMSGVYLVYELATPTTETAQAYTNPQVVDPDGTEEYVGSPIPVGHNTTYQRICSISGWDSVEVDMAGKNVLPVACNTTTKNGVTYTVYKNAKGAVTRIHAQGTATATHAFSVVEGVSAQNPFTLKAGSYWLKGLSDGASGQYDFNLRKLGTTQDIVQIQSKVAINLAEDTSFQSCYLFIYSGKTINTDIYPMIWLQSDSSDNFEPYQGTTYTSTFPKYKQQVTQNTIPYITKNIGDTYADTLTENLVGGTIAWNQLFIAPFSTTMYGVTFTRDVDRKSVTMSGTATSNIYKIVGDINKTVIGHVYYVDRDTSNTDIWICNDSGGVISNTNPETIGKATTANSFYIRIENGATVDETITPQIIDLTQMFGTTIADYIYSLEQGQAGVGVAWFKSLFPNDYYEYNSGELISVNASAHVIKDADGNVVHTYPLDSDLVLRGIPKLDANNKLYYDGDVYAPNGSVTRKYGVVDLGTLNWSLYTGYPNLFYNNFGLAKGSTNNRIPSNFVCIKYTPCGSGNVGGEGYTNGFIVIDYNGRIYINDTNYTTTAEFKAAMSGVMLVYELKTPTTEQADPFEENQTIVSNGVEEYTVTEQGDVEMPVGHDSTYYATEVYGGTIDMAKGVLTIDMVSVDLGTLNWAYQSTNNYFYGFPTNMKEYATRTNPLLCSNYETISDGRPFAQVPDFSTYNAIISDNPAVSVKDSRYSDATTFKNAMKGVQLVYELATPIEISLTPQQMQTLSGQNNIWSNTNGGMYLVYQLPITSLLVKRRDVADVSSKWLTLYSTPITQASDMDFTFIDFLNQYGKTYQYALVPVLAQEQSGVVVQIEGGYTVSENVDSVFDGVYIADQTNVERVKAGVGYGNIDMNQGVGSITPIGSKYPIVITNSQNQYHNGSIRGTIVPNDFYSNGNLSRIDMVNKRNELEQFLTNKRAKIIKDWNGNIWLVMIMSNVNCSFNDNYGMGMVSFSADWLEVGDPTNQQDLYNVGLINVGGV